MNAFIWYALKFPKMHRTNQSPQLQEKIGEPCVLVRVFDTYSAPANPAALF